EKIETTKEDYLFSYLAQKYPNLKKELKIANIQKETEKFIKECFLLAVISSLVLSIGTLYIFSEMKMTISFLIFSFIISFILFFFLVFNSLISRPKLLIRKMEREIDKELVFCGRHLLIELRAGTTLFDAMIGISEEYGEVSKEFKKITEKITLGVPATIAIYEVAQLTPSAYLKRVLLQIGNALTSGSSVADSLEAVLDQIAQEQIIKLKEYGQKLNPLSMFFMVFGIILPSIGITFAIIVFSLLGSQININGSGLLIAVMGMVIVIQMIFLSIADNSRPAFYV
ncbi:MAG: type II secretion system F family protein, partial [Candidatus Anstonellaceae archaeon]